MKKWILIFCLPFSLLAANPPLSHVITPQGGTDPLIENKKLIAGFYKALAENDAQMISEILAKNYKIQDSTIVFDSSYSKYDAFSKNILVRMKSLHIALPDFEITIIQMIAEDNQVLARVRMTGVQRGSFLGVEPTLKPVVINMFSVFTIDRGKITNVNEMWNELSVMKQIGHIVL